MFSPVKAMGPSLLALLAVKVAFSAAACSQYSVDTSTGTESFNHMSFIDFRNVAEVSANTNSAQQIDAVEKQGLAGITSSYFNSDAFTNNLNIQTWSSPATGSNPIAKQNLAQNVLIASASSSIGKRAVPFGDHHVAAHAKHVAKHLTHKHGVNHNRDVDKRATAPRTDGRCGSDFGGATCDPNGAYGGCCSSHGWCGTTAQHCLASNGCQNGCSTPSNSISPSPSTASASSPAASTNPSNPVTTGSPSGGSDGGSTMLSLISTRQSDHQSCAQIETLQETLMHASIRLYARVTGSQGACAGLFLYQSDSQESDIEILTSGDTGVFHATNQPGGADGATKVVGIPGSGSGNGSWSDWHEYRLDWLPGSSDWYVDGQLVDSKTVNVPTVGMLFAINLWSDGGSWSGSMPVGSSARLDIQWVQMVYNETSDSGAGAGAGGGACTVNNGPNAVQG